MSIFLQLTANFTFFFWNPHFFNFHFAASQEHQEVNFLTNFFYNHKLYSFFYHLSLFSLNLSEIFGARHHTIDIKKQAIFVCIWAFVFVLSLDMKITSKISCHASSIQVTIFCSFNRRWHYFPWNLEKSKIISVKLKNFAQVKLTHQVLFIWRAKFFVELPLASPWQ